MKYQQADQAYDRAIQLFRSSGDSASVLDTQKISFNLGGHLGQERASAAVLRTAMAEWQALGDRRGVARIATGLASKMDQLGNREQSIRYVNLALDLGHQTGDDASVAEAWLQLSGFATKNGNYSSAILSISKAERLYQKLHDEDGERDCLQAVASIYGLTERHGEALAIYARIREGHRDRADWSAWETLTVAMADEESLLGHPQIAWNYLIELLHHKRESSEAMRLPSSRFTFHTDQATWVAAKLAISGADQDFGARAFVFVDGTRTRFFADQAASLQQIRAALAPEDVLLEYIGREYLTSPAMMWVLTSAKLSVHRLPPPGYHALAEAVAAGFRQPVANGPHSSGLAETEKRRQLARLLLGPLLGELDGKRLLVVPDATLDAIPFAALPDPRHQDGSLLGDHHDIVYVPSAQAILALRDRPRRPDDQHLTVVADPVMNRYDSRLRWPADSPPEAAEWVATARSAGLLSEGGGLPRLANAAREARLIASGSPHAHLFAGFEATRENVFQAAGQARFLHVATHGIVDRERPERSGLALSLWDRKGRAVDGFLRFDEIATTPLSAELVTLGACETGVGRRVSHQGVPSLSNAFLHAGARRVVSALWKVDDAATSALMIEFYRHLFSAAKPPPAHALRLAQRHVASQVRWRDPYYWAGFVLYGDWRPL